jgi:hypothetical protein
MGASRFNHLNICCFNFPGYNPCHVYLLKPNIRRFLRKSKTSCYVVLMCPLSHTYRAKWKKSTWNIKFLGEFPDVHACEEACLHSKVYTYTYMHITIIRCSRMVLIQRYTCMHTYMHTCLYICLYNAQAFEEACPHSCIHAYMNAYINACMMLMHEKFAFVHA